MPDLDDTLNDGLPWTEEIGDQIRRELAELLPAGPPAPESLARPRVVPWKTPSAADALQHKIDQLSETARKRFEEDPYLMSAGLLRSAHALLQRTAQILADNESDDLGQAIDAKNLATLIRMLYEKIEKEHPYV